MTRRILSFVLAIAVLLSVAGSTGCTIKYIDEAARLGLGTFASNVFTGAVDAVLFPGGG